MEWFLKILGCQSHIIVQLEILAVIKFGGFCPTFSTVLADLNLVVWYGISIRTCMRKKIGGF